MVADDPPDIGLIAVPPGAELVFREDFFRILVADLHVIQAGVDAGAIDGTDEGVGKLVGIDQTAVADGAVEDLEFRTVGDPRGLVGHRGCSR